MKSLTGKRSWQEKLVNVVGPGTCFGDWGVVTAAIRTASLVCVTACELLVIKGHHFNTTVDPTLLNHLRSQATSGKAFIKKIDRAVGTAEGGEGVEMPTPRHAATGLSGSLSGFEKNQKEGQKEGWGGISRRDAKAAAHASLLAMER